MKTIDVSKLDQELTTGDLSIVLFSKERCVPCCMIIFPLQDVETEYKIPVFKVMLTSPNVKVNGIELTITEFPTTVIFNKTKPLSTTVGYRDAGELKNIIIDTITCKKAIKTKRSKKRK